VIADYVVVGAGSAGAVIASRLTEDHRTDVALIEAGGEDRNPWLHIPVGYGRTMTDPSVNWMYETEPEANCAGRRIFWPRGRVLGGTSAINGLVYMRGQAEDFDHWRQLGNAGWSHADVLPYFKRAEGNARGADAHHGADGPLGVSDIAPHPLADAFIDAAVEAGVARNRDFNGASQEGVGYYQLTTRRGRRSSTAVAYLKPARRRPNLAIVARALATRVIFEGRRAVGVAYRQGGVEKIARCRREVILCGGAINSPQLLLLSGVGPAGHVAGHGIAVIHDLAGVGRNLQDHYQARALYRVTRSVTLNDIMMSPMRQALTGLQWALFRRGMLTIGAGSVGMFVRTRPELATSDIQYHVILFGADKPGGSLYPFPALTVSVCQLRPESRGTVELKSADPTAAPAMRPNYLATEGDRRMLVEGMKLTRRIATMPALRDWIDSEFVPGPDVRTDDEMLDYIRRTGTTIYHPVGTCKMGGDGEAVVDERLRVRGLADLRVADASIMPTVVSGNTNAACIMIGEKAADMIREDARAG
jgi:choline dehydrogenase